MQEASRPEIFEDEDKPRFQQKKETKIRLNSETATRYIYGAFGLLSIAIVMTWLQFSTKAICCGDFDGYYHIRWSQMLWENFSSGKWLPDFNALPLTVLSPDSYADHHFLFHLLQIPFLWFFEPVTAAKVGAVFFATLAVFSCFWLILYYKVEHPLIWLLGLLTCANPFYYRMNMAKAPPIAIVFTVLGMWLLFERRYVWLLPLTFAFVWAYSLYPMLIIGAIIWAVIVFWNDSKFEWQPIAYTAAGAFLGNIINPYFPRNIFLFFEHLQTKLRTGGGYDVPVGGEWYAYDSWMFLGLCAVAMLAMVLGYILYAPNEKRLEEKSTFLLFFATFLMIWTFQSKRFTEYFPPMAILFGAFSFQAFLTRPKTDVPQLPEDFRLDLAPYLDKPTVSESEEKQELWKNALVGLICFLLIVHMFLTLRGFELKGQKIEIKGLAKELSENDPPERFQKGMEWAAKNIPEKDETGKPTRIFNTDWDDFPKMFFHDTKHAYIAGLDPKYLHSRNPELWKLYEQITLGKMDDPAPVIRDKFGARYIFSDLHHDDFYAKIMESGWVEKIYEDDDSMILKIRDEKGEPPSETGDFATGETSPDDAPDDAVDDADETNETSENNGNK